jgi:hypothetical protein
MLLTTKQPKTCRDPGHEGVIILEDAVKAVGTVQRRTDVIKITATGGFKRCKSGKNPQLLLEEIKAIYNCQRL